jgi:hypothetical protein
MMVRVRKTEPMRRGNQCEVQNGSYAWLRNLSDHDTRFPLASRCQRRNTRLAEL